MTDKVTPFPERPKPEGAPAPKPGRINILPGNGFRDPAAMLHAAQHAGLRQVVILGWKDDDGKDGEFWMSASCAYLREISWLLESARHEVMRHMEGD